MFLLSQCAYFQWPFLPLPSLPIFIADLGQKVIFYKNVLIWSCGKKLSHHLPLVILNLHESCLAPDIISRDLHISFKCAILDSPLHFLLPFEVGSHATSFFTFLVLLLRWIYIILILLHSILHSPMLSLHQYCLKLFSFLCYRPGIFTPFLLLPKLPFHFAGHLIYFWRFRNQDLPTMYLPHVTILKII